MIAGFDTYLAVFDATGQRVAQNDDGSFGLNAQIELAPGSAGARLTWRALFELAEPGVGRLL
jgi:hypothetical protein